MTSQPRGRGWGRRRPGRGQIPTPDDTLVAWANVGKIQPAHIALLQVCYEEKVDVIQVQEPWTGYPTRTQSHPGYEVYAPVDAWGDTDERPRVLTYVRKGAKLEVQQRRPVGSRDLLWIDVNGVSFLNFYREPRTDPVVDYLTSLVPPGRCIAGGDANANHELWEPGVETRNRGQQIAQWCRDSGMAYTGQAGVPTQRAGHTIDLVFSNVPFVTTETSEILHSGSDHQTLLTKVPGRGSVPLDQFHYRVPKSSLTRFAGVLHIATSSLPDPDSFADGDTARIDDWINQFNQGWLDALQATGKQDRPTGRAAPWWTDECKEARIRWHRLRRQQGHEIEEVTELRKEFHRTVRDAKRQYWRDMIDGVETDAQLYKVVGWHKLGPRLKSPPLIIEGVQIEGTKEKAQALAQNIIQRFTSADDLVEDPLQDWEEAELNPDLDCIGEASMEEVEACTVAVRSTSPGVDHTTVRLLSACWWSIKNAVRGLFNKCLRAAYYPKAWKLAEVVMIPKPGKKDLSSCRSYRPIALISCLGKGLERLVARRMTWSALRGRLISPQQAGALPKRAATDLVAAFVNDAEWGLVTKKVTSILTLDVQGAFDAVLAKRLLQRMRLQGWPVTILRMVQHFLTDRSVRVRLEGETTEPLPLDCGTPQGSPLSPLLYLLYLAELLNQNRKLRFGFADDLALVRTSKDLRTNVALLQQDAQEVLEWCERNKVYFAWEKSELLHISAARSDADPPVVINGNTIQPVAEPQAGNDTPSKLPALRWLGVYIDRKLTFRRHISERCSKAEKVAWHLRSLANTKYGPPAHSIRKAVITCVLPTALYGAEVWYGGRTRPARNRSQAGKDLVSARVGWHVERIQRVINIAARAILPVWRTSPNGALCRDAALPTAQMALEEIRLRFALRLYRVDDMHPLVSRMAPPLVERGVRSGTRHRARTKVQLAAEECGGFDRPVLAGPRYTTGSRTDPTEGDNKKSAALKFLKWYSELPPGEVVVFTDGSKGEKGLGYGYIVMQSGRDEPIAEGKGKLDDCGVVFDAEALGAWRGLERALQEAIPGTRVTVCLDNTGVIWCLRGTSSETSQWAFLAFQRAADAWHGTVSVKWSPGHMGIEPNEVADRLANLGTKASHDPDTRPTLAGVRSQVRKRLRGLRANVWRATEATLSRRYKSWDLPYDTRHHPEELEVLTRPQLQRLLAIRTGHGDFAWYHRRYKHDEAELRCGCGRPKTPDHLVMCRQTRRSFDKWPWPGEGPRVRPQTRAEKKDYLRFLMGNPLAFKEFLEVTRFYADICPRSHA
jgi:ribonuclease HI